MAAQSDVSMAGGRMRSASGSVSFTCGQVACVTAYSSVGGGSVQQGVQQPYCQARHDTLRMSACDGYYWAAADTLLLQSGEQSRKIRGSDGCESDITLHLDVHPTFLQLYSLSVCDSFYWPVTGQVYRDSIEVERRGTTSFGCDSVQRLSLVVRRSSVKNIYDQAFQSYDWYGQHIVESGVYQHSFVNAEGCDSTLRLTLSVMRDYPMPIIVCYDRKAVMVDHFPGLWATDGVADTSRVDYPAYRWYHNGTLLPLSTGDIFSDFSDGVHHELTGCYYVEVQVSEGSPYWVASNTVCMGLGIDDVEEPQVLLYPNPVASGSMLQVETRNVPLGSDLWIYDMRGRRLVVRRLDSDHISLPVRMVAGVYSAVIRLGQESLTVKRFIVR